MQEKLKKREKKVSPDLTPNTSRLQKEKFEGSQEKLERCFRVLHLTLFHQGRTFLVKATW